MTDTPAESPLLFEVVDDHIAVVRFNRPQARNAIDGATALALSAAVERIESDPALRVAIMASSTPGMFCAGADLKVVAAGRTAELRPNDGGFGGFVDALRDKPWIAAVDGPALGGGTELCLACDMIVSSPGTRFGLPEVKRGLIANGGDVKGWADRGDWTFEKQLEELRWKQRIPLIMKTCPKVIIAALHGHVLGAGLSVALAADFRIATESAQFGTSFANVGFAGDFGSTSSLVQLVGSAKARELMMLTPRISAQEALALGLVTRVVGEAELVDAVEAMARQLASGPYQAWGYMKRNLLAAESEPLATVIEVEALNQARCIQTEDHQEAIRAFAEKRAPVFKGR